MPKRIKAGAVVFALYVLAVATPYICISRCALIALCYVSSLRVNNPVATWVAVALHRPHATRIVFGFDTELVDSTIYLPLRKCRACTNK